MTLVSIELIPSRSRVRPPSTSSSLPVSQAVQPAFAAVELAALLDVPRMCENGGIGHTEKTLCDNASHLEAIEVVSFYLLRDPYQRLSDLCRSNRTEEHHLHFASKEKEVPPGSVDFSVQSKAVKDLHHAPILEVGLNSRARALGPYAATPRQSGWCRLERLVS
jgi:hypothetical protein